MQKLLLAPMATLSHQALRLLIANWHNAISAQAQNPIIDNLANTHPCDEYYTEMINAASFLAGGKFEKYYVYNAPEPQKIVWQMTSGDAELLAKLAKELSNLDGIGVDINMGCCAPEIVKQGAGISWMTKPLEETRKMVQGVRDALASDKRLSVKMRLGKEDFTKQSLFDFADMLVQSGVTRIVLHPRTQKEKFKRTARYEYAEELATHIKAHYSDKISVCANGDITDIASFARATKIAPHLDGIMIGRGAVQKPWLFELIKNYQNSQIDVNGNAQNNCTVQSVQNLGVTVDLLELGKMFIEFLAQSQPEEFYLTRSQRFFAYFCQNLQFSHYLFCKIAIAKSLAEVEKLFCAYFAEQAHERYKII